MIIFRLGLITAMMGCASPALSGEIIRESATSDFEWKSTECRRPTKPYVRQSDPAGQAHMQDFAMKVAVYLDCLKTEAQRDFDRAQTEMHQAIQTKLQRETDTMNDDVERMVRDRPR